MPINSSDGIKRSPARTHAELVDVSTPHTLPELEAAVASEPEVDGKIVTHAGVAAAHHAVHVKTLADHPDSIIPATIARDAEVDSKITTHAGSAAAHQPRSHNHSLIADGTPIAVAGVPNLPTSKITSGRFSMPRMPAGTAGLVLTAQGAGINPVYTEVGAAALVIRKTANESVVNSTVLQNDNHLFFPAAANEVWVYDLYILVRASSTTPDLRVGWSLPSGTFYIKSSSVESSAVNLTVLSIPVTLGVRLNVFHGLLVIGTVAGTARFQWAQNVLSGTGTILMANTCLIAYKAA